ncbi:hypothetical protein AJ80_03203 [Polytolypa hystricis UAMH7299]|uniref:Glutaredoxin-like protein n=1 Tax=Polytolypa hystricis (strain UAMH7299) TaxID=1447883 RepID=A0A2B7YJP4_POLH7|nr:hypothetical protein AJ80_03203 [Polytolypa hystricis UAMH7299]
MHPTRILAQNIRLTLFTRVNCGLCDTAKHTVTQLQKRKPFLYAEKDIMLPENKPWKDVYEFDVPVLHVQRIVDDNNDKESLLSDPKKLFHRFTEEEVEKTIEEVKGEN